MDFSMESSDHWLQGTNIDDVEECGIMDSLCSSSPPIVERRVRPPQDQALKCPRCESTNTKFCYYNNYSLSQPRYFCKTCRRYWTKGGTLRNIPVGGGCRKNKKVSNKKSSANDVVPLPQHRPHDHDHDHDRAHAHDHLQLHQAMQFSHPMGVGLMLDQFHTPFEFVGGINMINGTTSFRDFDHHHHHHQGFDMNGHIHENNGLLLGPNFQGFGGTLCSFDDDAYNNVNNSGTYVMDSSSSQQRQMLPHDHHHNDGNEDQIVGAIHDVKPNPKILALQWQDQGCSDVGKQPFGGYMSGLGSWTGMINGYGSSTTNSFV